MAVPQHEEVISLAAVESLAHLLDTALRVHAEASLQLTIHVLGQLLIQKI